MPDPPHGSLGILGVVPGVGRYFHGTLGFVHGFDETSLEALIWESDTVTDFIPYLPAKQALYEGGAEVEFDAGEEDLLALYLHRGRKFPPELRDPGRLRDGIWEEVTAKEESARIGIVYVLRQKELYGRKLKAYRSWHGTGDPAIHSKRLRSLPRGVLERRGQEHDRRTPADTNLL